MTAFSAPTLPKPHYPSKIANTLASLVKGRWIDGKAQALILLLSACDMPTIFMLQTFLPSRRRDCFTPTSLSIPTTFSKAHQPLRPVLNLPPLSKVRCCRPKKFGRLPEGLLPIRTNPPKPSLSLENRHHPRFLKSIQTKLKTAPVTLRERFNCILL